MLQASSILQEVRTDWSEKAQISLFVKRDDQLHPYISGNKWRKLLPFIQKIQTKQINGIASFGGVWSNHLHALAFAGQHFQFPTYAYIRGEHLPTAMLQDAEAWGMQITSLSRSTYRQHAAQGSLPYPFSLPPDTLVLPEGGFHYEALAGFQSFFLENHTQPTHWVLATGTACTLAGMLAYAPAHTKIEAVSVLKGLDHTPAVQHLLAKGNKTAQALWTQHSKYHFGGYAKTSPELFEFMQDFEQQTGIQLDPVYTAKAAFALFDLCRNKYFPLESKVALVHTGGLQGRRGYKLQNI